MNQNNSKDCYQYILSPQFFYTPGDCGDVNHDIKVSNGDLLSSDDQLISAALIQLSTDMYLDGERGFFGDEFLDFPIGNHTWTLNGKPNIEGLTVQGDRIIRQALEPLIDQQLIDEIQIRTVRVIDGIEATVKIFRNGSELFRLVI